MSSVKIASVFLVLLGLSACANNNIANSEALSLAAVKDAGSVEKSLDNVIHEATLSWAEASNDGLAFYSPLHMDQAKKALEEAKKLNQADAKQEEKEEAMVQAVSVEKFLVSGRANKERVETLLAKSLDHRKVLLELGSDKVLPKEYDKGMGLLDAAIKEVAGGNLKKVEKRQVGVLAYFNKVEADTLRVQWLSGAKLMMEKAKDIDADDFAEKSYEQARRAYDTADDFIGTNFRNREEVRAISATAYSKAAAAYYIALEVQKVAGKKAKEVESYMLSMQSLFDSINRGFGVENLQSQSFSDQARLLDAAISKK